MAVLRVQVGHGSFAHLLRRHVHHTTATGAHLRRTHFIRHYIFVLCKSTINIEGKPVYWPMCFSLPSVSQYTISNILCVKCFKILNIYVCLVKDLVECPMYFVIKHSSMDMKHTLFLVVYLKTQNAKKSRVYFNQILWEFIVGITSTQIKNIIV